MQGDPESETRSQVEISIVPGLALQPSFWVGWLGKVATLVGLVALAAALVRRTSP
jgi:hypothetical protein